MYLSALSTVLYVTTYCCETVCGPWKCQSRKSVLWLVYRWMGVTYVFCCVYARLQWTGERNKVLPPTLCLLLPNEMFTSKPNEVSRRPAALPPLLRLPHHMTHLHVSPNQVFPIFLPFFISRFIYICYRHTGQTDVLRVVFKKKKKTLFIRFPCFSPFLHLHMFCFWLVLVSMLLALLCVNPV